MRRVHYAWIVAAVGLLSLVTAAGVRSTSGVLIVPLQNEFGWSRATISGGVALNLIVFGLGGPFAAALAERFGLRKVIAGAVAAIVTGSGLSLLMTAPWQLYILWGVLIAAGTGAISLPLGAMIANRWFVERRGLVTGLLTASNATGQLIFLPALAWIVGAWGWRYAAATGAVVALVGVLPLALVLLAAAVIVGFALYGAQRWLFWRTRRRLNPGLVVASVAGLVSLLWLGIALGVARADLLQARAHGSTPVAALAHPRSTGASRRWSCPKSCR